MDKVRGLFQRDGSPHWQIRFADETGRIREKTTGTTSKKLAREILAKTRTQVAEDKYLDVKKTPKTTFHELCEQYWATRGKMLRMKGVASMIESWKVGLGNPAVKELTTAKIETFLNGRISPSQEGADDKKPARKFGAASRNRHATMLKALFNWGVREQIITSNPVAGVQKLRETGSRTRYLDRAEIDSLLSAASDDFRPILLTAIHTGMRRGEIFNLKWSDVDLKNRVLTVQESKSGKKRAIDLTETLCAVLKDLRSRFAKGYVFPSPEKEKNSPLTDIHHTFRRAVVKAGISEVRFHDLRHTFASHLVMEGADLNTVRELLGHHSIAMTMRYAHLAASHKRQAVQKLDTALTGTSTNSDSTPAKSQAVALAASEASR